MLSQHLYDTAPQGKEDESFIRMLYQKLGFAGVGPSPLETPNLLEVTTESGRFIKLWERLEETQQEGRSVRLMDGGRTLVVTRDDHGESFFLPYDWCCLLPTTEVEFAGPSGEWLNYEKILELLPSFGEGVRYQVSISYVAPYLLVISGHRQSSNGMVEHRFFEGQWRFRKQDDTPVVYVPRAKDEVVKYIRVFF